MTDAFLWHMVGVDRLRMIGKARSIILWDKTVIVIDGTRPDYKIHVTPLESPPVAHMVAILQTQAMEQRGLTVKSVYGLRGANGGFATNVATAHRFYLMRELESLELIVADMTFVIQRDGEKLNG